MRFLSAGDLAEQVVADGGCKELAVAGALDGDAPGQHDGDHQRDTPARTQAAPDVEAAFDQREGVRGAETGDQDVRALEHEPAAECDPEARRPAREQRAHRHQDGGQQGGVDGGHPAFGVEQNADSQQQSGQEPGFGAEQGGADRSGEQHVRGRGNQRGNPIRPGLVGRRGRVRDRIDEADGAGFQPVDAGGLFPARLVLEADIDQVARAQHLPRRFQIATFVPIERRKADPSGQQCQERKDRKECVTSGFQRQAFGGVWGHASGVLRTTPQLLL